MHFTEFDVPKFGITITVVSHEKFQINDEFQYWVKLESNLSILVRISWLGGVLAYSLGGGVPLGLRKSYPLLDQILQMFFRERSH